MPLASYHTQFNFENPDEEKEKIAPYQRYLYDDYVKEFIEKNKLQIEGHITFVKNSTSGHIMTPFWNEGKIRVSSFYQKYEDVIQKVQEIELGIEESLDHCVGKIIYDFGF